MNEKYLLLERSIERDLEVIDEIFTTIDSWQIEENTDQETLIVLGYRLHNLYNAFENIFQNIAEVFENSVDDSARWHAQLLQRMRLDVMPVRPAVIDDATYDSLDEFIALATSRRSIRRYRPDPIPRDVIENLLQAAVKAPNAHNRQPWRFVVMTDKVVQRHLADEMAVPFRRDLLRDGHTPEEAAGIVQRSKERIGEAPALILANLTMLDMDTYPDDERQRCEWLMAAQGVALACQNLLLAAHAAGLGACWMCAPIFCPDTVRAALELPADWEPQGLITLGWPANEGRDRERKPLDEVVRWMV